MHLLSACYADPIGIERHRQPPSQSSKALHSNQPALSISVAGGEEYAWDYGAKDRGGQFYLRVSKGFAREEGTLKCLEDEQVDVCHVPLGQDRAGEPQAVW